MAQILLRFIVLCDEGFFYDCSEPTKNALDGSVINLGVSGSGDKLSLVRVN